MHHVTDSSDVSLPGYIPGAVMGWMAAWGIWDPARPSVTVRSDTVWLPSATGWAVHEVAPGTLDVLGHVALSRCSSRGRRVALVVREPVSPGDVIERGTYMPSRDALDMWQKIGVSLRAYDRLKYANWERFADVDWAFGYVLAVARNDMFSDRLVDLGPRWQTMPDEGHHLLPWLILAAANGIDRCCARCAATSLPAHRAR